jgi:8-oxo-dGTP diphosphatase
MYRYPHPHPAVTTDTVVLRSHDAGLSILLIRRANPPFAGAWALPGGFLEIDEDLEACARRELREEAGIEPEVMEQLHCFGDPARDPRERVISVAFVAWVNSTGGNARAGSDAAEIGWFPEGTLPDVAFDHAQIISLALERIRDGHRRCLIGSEVDSGQ